MDAAPSEAKSALIEMRGVTVGSMQDPSLSVVEGVDWTVHTGDFWVVAGLQGAGKSDLLMMTGGVMPPLSGQYFLCGEEMPIFDEARLKQRLRLGLVFEGGQLLNHFKTAPPRTRARRSCRYSSNWSWGLGPTARREPSDVIGRNEPGWPGL